MRIQPINSNYYRPQLKNFTFGAKLNTDCINRLNFSSIQTDFDIALSKINKIRLNEYLTLSETEKNLLRENIKTSQRITTKILDKHFFSAEAIKQAFDEEFGKDNYILIVIGRSISSIGKLVGLKIGEDRVKNIPMSDLGSLSRNCPLDYIAWKVLLSNWNKRTNKQDFLEYLDTMDLNRNKIENSDKQYVIMDFTASGRSLDFAYGILTSEDYLGNKKNNIKKCSFMDILPQYNHVGKRFGIMLDLMSCAYKDFSSVGRILTMDKDHLVQASDPNVFIGKYNDSTNKKLQTYRLFGFAMLDRLFEETNNKNFSYSKINLDHHKKMYEEQKKFFWERSEYRFIDDITLDGFALYNIMTSFEESNDKVFDKLFKLSNELNSYEKSSKNLGKNLKTSEYYTKFRPKLLKIIDEYKK